MRILHAADLHLDSPLSSLPAPQAAQRRRELRDIPHRLAQLARAEGADVVLLGGDLLDADRVYPQSIQAMAQALGELSIPVFIAPGNHDPYTPQSPYAAASWPDNVHIFSTPQMEAVELPQLGAVIHGCAFPAPHREDSPLSGYTVARDGRLHILCLHGEVAPTGRYAPILPGQLGATGAHYAALGHVHRCSGLQREGETYWAYPGCPEGRGFDEVGEKGCLLVDVTHQGTTARFLPLCCRKYRIQEVDVDNLSQTLAQMEYSEDLVRLTVTEGRYHEVKRLLAAVGHPVLSLAREAMGGVSLDAALDAGEGRPLTGDEIARLFERVAAIEKRHEERYNKLLSNVEKDEVWVKTGPRRWECRCIQRNRAQFRHQQFGRRCNAEFEYEVWRKIRK